MVGGDGVSEVQEAIGAGDVLHRVQLQAGFLEVRRVVDVSGLLVPVVLLAALDFERVPSVGSFGDSGVHFIELLLVHEFGGEG